MPYIDAIESSPEHYKLVKWHGDNRLIEFTLKAGERDSLHSHQESICLLYTSDAADDS